MKKYFIPFTLVALLFFSCTKKNNVENSDFSIYIPTNLKASNEILDTAELQYFDIKSNLFVAVEKINKSKYPNIDTLCEAYIFSLFDNIIDLDTVFENNKYASKKIELFEDGFNDKYNWNIKVLSTEKYYYIVWTWSANNNYATNKKIMKQITSSFKFK